MKISLGRRFWIVTTVIIVLFSIFFVGKNLLRAIRIKREVNQLEREQEFYLDRITRDSTLVNQLRYDDYLEEFAREKYGMQRPNEDVYQLSE